MSGLQNAQSLIAHYQKKPQQNFGIGIYIFNRLWKMLNYLPIAKYPDYEKFREFISANRGTLEKTDFSELLKNEMRFSNFIIRICCEFSGKNYDKNNLSKYGIFLIKESSKVQSLSVAYNKKLMGEKYKAIGSACALFFDAELEPGKINVKKTKKMEGRDNIYRQDPEFLNWPVNRIENSNIYASKGPAWTKEKSPVGFFIEIFNKSVDKTGHNITTIVALGEPGKDFIDYFKRSMSI